MKTYEEMVREYRKRRRDTIVDSLAMGLTYVDEIAVETGLLEEAGLMAELSGAVTGTLPFIIIAATEGSKVLLGRKPGKTATKDLSYRMVKTGAAMGIGAAVTSAAGFWAAIPATMGTRALFDMYRSRLLTSRRVAARIDRLKELNRMIRRETEEPVPEAGLALDAVQDIIIQ